VNVGRELGEDDARLVSLVVAVDLKNLLKISFFLALSSYNCYWFPKAKVIL
jgi:hypothetical protein